MNGHAYKASDNCALCGAPFDLTVESSDGLVVKAWRGKDNRLYCCPEHAEFTLAKALEWSEEMARRVN